MGTWGVGNFSNDDAMDWVQHLEDGAGPEILRETLSNAIANAADDSVPDVVSGLAAAEVVAAWHGYPSNDLPEAVIDWIARHGQADGSLIHLALALLTEAEEHSEIASLWRETERAAEWCGVIAALRSRLERAGTE